MEARERRDPSNSFAGGTIVNAAAKKLIRNLLPKESTKHTILSGPLRGARIYTSWHDYPGAILGTTERPLLSWFQANVGAGETWLDVGAHYGYTAIALSRLVGESGRVFAFEPVASTAAWIERTRAANALPQLTVVPMGLSDQPRPSTLLLPSIRGMADSTIPESPHFETISAVSLDDYWPELAGPGAPIHGIKIDVQGMELQALRGMRQVLLTWAPKLIVEFHRGVDRGQVLDLLVSAGYSSHYQLIDGEPDAERPRELADDRSYFFEPQQSQCASSLTRSTTNRS